MSIQVDGLAAGQTYVSDLALGVHTLTDTGGGTNHVWSFVVWPSELDTPPIITNATSTVCSFDIEQDGIYVARLMRAGQPQYVTLGFPDESGFIFPSPGQGDDQKGGNQVGAAGWAGRGLIKGINYTLRTLAGFFRGGNASVQWGDDGLIPRVGPIAVLLPSGGSDTAAITAELAHGRAHLGPGTFIIDSDVAYGSANTTISAHPNARLQPTSGKLVTLAGNLDFPGQNLDTSEGGAFAIADGGSGPTVVKPDWFTGCDRTGSNDSSAAVQAAHDALPDVGGVIEFQAGYYKLSNVTFSKNGVRLRGAQRFATTILDASATADLFTFTGCGLLDIEDLEIRRPLLADVKTAGATLRFNGVTNSNIRRVRISQPYQGIHVYGGSGGITLDKLTFLPGTSAMTWDYAIKIENTACCWIKNINCNMGSNVTVLTALLVLDGGCDTMFVTDSVFNQVNTDIGSYGDPFPSNGGTCVKLQNTNGSFDPRWLHLTNVVTESINGVGIDVSAANQLTASGCTVQTSLIGIRVTGGNDLRFVGGFVNQIQQHGIQVTGGKRVSFLAQEVTACSRELTNTYSGFLVQGPAQDVHVIGCAIGDTDTLGAVGWSMAYGINTPIGTSDDDAGFIYRENVFGSLCTANEYRGIDRVDYGSRFEAEGTAAPTGGTWSRGDVVHALTPSDGGPAGWICTAAGTPGTWVPWYVHAVAPTAASTNSAPVIRDSSGEAAFDTITLDDLTGSQAVVTDSGKKLASLAYASTATASTLVVRDGSAAAAFAALTGTTITASTALSTNAWTATSLFSATFVGSSSTTRTWIDGSGSASDVIIIGHTTAGSFYVQGKDLYLRAGTSGAETIWAHMSAFGFFLPQHTASKGLRLDSNQIIQSHDFVHGEDHIATDQATLTATSFTDLLTVTKTTGAGNADIWFECQGTATTAAASFQLVVDGVSLTGYLRSIPVGTSQVAISARVSVTAASHTFKIQYKVGSSGNLAIRPQTQAEGATLLVQETA